MRNMDPERGLVNSAKCVVRTIYDNVVLVELIDKNPRDEFLLIPRISFKQRLAKNDPRSPLVLRNQFPLQLCYAMTLNKSQGQTLTNVGLDLRDDSFSHGHTYVGFGRVRGRDKVVVLVRDDRIVGGTALIRNVVYPQLLRHLHGDLALL